MKIPILVLTAIALTQLEATAATTGQVTLPLAEYLAAHQPSDPFTDDAPPPVDAAITNATLALTATETALTGSATFAVATFSPGWHLVPLFGGPASIRRSDPADAPLVTHDGRLALLVQGAGRH